MATIDEELHQLEAQLQQWRELLDALATRAQRGDPEAGAERQQRIDDLRASHREAQSTLADVKAIACEKKSNDDDGTWSAVESKFFRTQ